MMDLKNYLLLDEQKIYNSIHNPNKLGKLHTISDEVSYWKALFTYHEQRTALENFLLYRTASELGLYKYGAHDADITPPALDTLTERLYSIFSVKKVEVGLDIGAKEKHRTFLVHLTNGEKIYLESDTANSLMGDLRKFLIEIIVRTVEIPRESKWWEATYMKEYKLVQPLNCFRNYYFSTLIAKLPKIINDLNDEIALECFKQLEIRASLIHTPKNMILVPYGYNALRGRTLSTYTSHKKINDRLDLTIVDFKEMIADKTFGDKEFQERLSTKRSKNTRCTIASIKFLLEHQEQLFPPIPKFSTEAEKSTMKGILKRTKIINQSLL